LKPSTEALLLAIELVIQADIERRSDLTPNVMKKIIDLRSDIQYLKEIDCE
jgi:hypothetical protein